MSDKIYKSLKRKAIVLTIVAWIIYALSITSFVLSFFVAFSSFSLTIGLIVTGGVLLGLGFWTSFNAIDAKIEAKHYLIVPAIIRAEDSKK